MARLDINSLVGFIAVARERSFTRAAAQLGVTPSALSHRMRGFEERLGLRLLARTTRAVVPTEAGERLLRTLGPRFDEINADLESLSELRDTPTGTVRITASDHVIQTLLWPRLAPVLIDYPNVQVELITDYGLTDIVTERFDAGVRLGDHVAKGMISQCIGPDVRFVVVGAPSYFNAHPRPETPEDLVAHRAVNLRLPTYGGLYAWEFEKAGKEQRVRMEGQLAFNGIYHVLEAVLAGYGLAHLPGDVAARHLSAGALVSVLEDWCPTWPGYHLYYPSRRQSSPAFKVVADALRTRG